MSPALAFFGRFRRTRRGLARGLPGLPQRPMRKRDWTKARPAARVGPGQIGAGDQSLGLPRTSLIGPQRFALPLARLAVLALDPGARHGDLGCSGRAGQRARAMTVPGAGDGRGVIDAGLVGGLDFTSM